MGGQFEAEAPPPRVISETPKERRERHRQEQMTKNDAEMQARREKCASPPLARAAR